MRQVEILSVGKLSMSFLKDGCAEYEKRLRPMCKLTLTELPETKLLGDSAAQEQAVIESEGDKVLAHLEKQKNAYVIAMCVEGKGMTSEALACSIESATDSGKKVVFVIGGSLGLSDRVKKRADVRLSVSQMTFPHQLAKLLLLEQVYRAFTIIGNIKYHK